LSEKSATFRDLTLGAVTIGETHAGAVKKT
jgi:hypothetical protein